MSALNQDEAMLSMRGSELTTEETAAVVAVISQLSAARAERGAKDAGTAGPADRTQQRRHRLALDQHGLWGRPGPASWTSATAGIR